MSPKTSNIIFVYISLQVSKMYNKIVNLKEETLTQDFTIKKEFQKNPIVLSEETAEEMDL